MLLYIDDPGCQPKHHSLLRDTGHANVATLLRKETALRPAENRLTVAPMACNSSGRTRS